MPQGRARLRDGARAFAMLLGVAVLASMAFCLPPALGIHVGVDITPGLVPGRLLFIPPVPAIWVSVDATPGFATGRPFFISHSLLRLSLFLVIAGLFARWRYRRHGASAPLV
jgi:hypothetical protein